VAPRQVVRSLATAGVVVAVPLLLYVVLNTTVFDRPLFQGSADGAVVVAANPNAKQPILNEQLSYTWQLFLPRLPFMNDSFVGTKPIWDTWFMGLNGRFGVLDYSFSPDFNRFALWAVFIPILLLAGVGLWRSRSVLRRRLPELAVYLVGVVGLMLAIGKPSYEQWVANDPFPFYQPRYILVLLPLYAAIAALAVRGAGRRLGPAVGAGIVMLALAHTFFAQLLTIERFYT
jgi:hypothetical protein